MSEPQSLLQVSGTSETTEEETYIIKRLSKGKSRSVIASDEEEEEETPKRRARSESSQSASPPLFSSQEFTEQTPIDKDVDSGKKKDAGEDQDIGALLAQQDEEEEAHGQREQERAKERQFLQTHEDPLVELSDLFSDDKDWDEREKSNNKACICDAFHCMARR